MIDPLDLSLLPLTELSQRTGSSLEEVREADGEKLGSKAMWPHCRGRDFGTRGLPAALFPLICKVSHADLKTASDGSSQSSLSQKSVLPPQAALYLAPGKLDWTHLPCSQLISCCVRTQDFKI